MTRTLSIAPTLLLAFAGLALPACDDAAASNECDEYVDYMCDCHSEEYDCQQLRNTYSDPDYETLDECAIALEDQEKVDAEDGADCGDSGTAR